MRDCLAATLVGSPRVELREPAEQPEFFHLKGPRISARLAVLTAALTVGGLQVLTTTWESTDGIVSSDLLTWSVENPSAFCFRTVWRDRIIRLKPSTRKQGVCFIKHLTKGPKGSRPMWGAERG
jgi:hypothetical protein